MSIFYFVFEVDPKSENPVIGHVSKAMAHIWVSSSCFDEAKDKALEFLNFECWDVSKEIKSYKPNVEQLDALDDSERLNYQKAKSDGIHANFYYWHRSD